LDLSFDRLLMMMIGFSVVIVMQ